MSQALAAISLQEFLRTRRSVRRFTSEPVEGDVLARILETATYAPSAHNRQPWRFAVVISQAAKIRLADEMGAEFRRDLLADGLQPAEANKMVTRSRERIVEAPVVVLLCQDPTIGDDYPDAARRQAEHIMGLQGVTLAGGTLLLAAHAEGLGGVWVCAPLFAQDAVKQALGLPERWEPQGMLLLGYAAMLPSPRPRRPVEEVTLYL